MSRYPARSRLIAAAVVASLAAAAPSSMLAQGGPRAAAPAGAEIAAKAKAARLDRANAGAGEFQGKRITFTPAQLDPSGDLADGQMIGVLENEVAGDETGLPAGRYNLFAAQLADGWHVYAESDGQIVKEALRVKVERRAGPPADRRPRFRAVGWGYDMEIERTPLPPPPPPVATVTLTPASLSVLLGASKQFTVELRDANGALLSGRAVTWTSSAPAIVSVASGGVVTAVAAGQATITATSGGKSGSATVVVPAPTYTIYTSGRSSMSAGQTAQVYAYVYSNQSSCYTCPAVNQSEIAWASSNTAIARVYGAGTSSGQSTAQLQAVAEGSVVITASYRGSVAQMPLTVTRALVGWVNVAPSPLTVAVTQPGQLAATVYDATGKVVTDRPVSWSSTDPAIADVTTAGRVIPVAVGSTTIKASVEGVSTTTPVVVGPVPVSTVAVTPASTGIGAGQFTQLETTLKDAAGNVVTGRTVIWTTDNPTIADVTASGRVLAVASGSATITATSEGKSGKATITVPAPSTGGPATTSMTESISFSW